jgi:cytochrome c oxidase assembly protein subunit 15
MSESNRPDAPPNPAAASVATSTTAIPKDWARRMQMGFSGLVALTFGLIVLGALVRAHDAGLACPDWPLCFGEVIPQMNLEVAFEWSHRSVAGAVALWFAALAWSSRRQPNRPASMDRLLAVAALLLGVQILLGALTVWLKLASWTVTAHLLTGNAFALTCFCVVLVLREQALPTPAEARPRAPDLARWALAVVSVCLFFQVALGGLVSSQYAGMACPEWPACNGGVFFPSWSGSVGLHLLHRMNGYALVLGLGIVAWLCRGEPALRRATALACLLGFGQAVVGIANVLTGIPAQVTGLHSALAAALVLNMTFAARETWFREHAR